MAYCEWQIQKPAITVAISATYKLNSSGSRTDPWGTPNAHAAVDERSVPTRMNCDRSVKYESSHWIAQPEIPKVYSNLGIPIYRLADEIEPGICTRR